MAGVRKRLGSLLGPTGQAAGIAAVTAEQVAPTALPQVTTSGPNTAKSFHFKIPQGPQGLPGLESVPTPEGIAQNLTLPGPARTALDAIAGRGISVASKGAIGDGVTDDSAAIRSAIASAVTFGAPVWLPPGKTYLVSRVDANTAYALGVPAGQTLLSNGATIKLAASQLDYTSVVRPLGAGVTIQGVTIDGNLAGQSVLTQKQRHGVYVQNAADVAILDCRIINCAGDGVLLYNGAERANVKGNFITGCARSGVAFAGTAHEASIVGNRIYGNVATPIDGEVEGAFARDVHVRGNHLEAVPGEYALTVSTTTSTDRNLRWLIQGNTIVGGVYLVRSTASRVIGNAIRTTAGTIPAITASVTDRATIADNVIDAFAKGIVALYTLATAPTSLTIVNNDIASGSGAIELSGVLDGMVRGNRCVGSGAGDGIVATTTGGPITDLEVSENHIRGFAGSAIYVGTAGGYTINGLTVVRNKVRGTMTYGVRFAGIAADFSSALAENNVSSSGVTYPFFDNSTGGPVQHIRPIGRVRETYGTAAPTTGSWAVGDRCWNATPAAGGVSGWVCVTAGTPGVWKALGAVAA